MYSSLQLVVNMVNTWWALQSINQSISLSLSLFHIHSHTHTYRRSLLPSGTRGCTTALTRKKAEPNNGIFCSMFKNVTYEEIKADSNLAIRSNIADTEKHLSKPTHLGGFRIGRNTVEWKVLTWKQRQRKDEIFKKAGRVIKHTMMTAYQCSSTKRWACFRLDSSHHHLYRSDNFVESSWWSSGKRNEKQSF